MSGARRGGLGADRVGGVAVAGQFPVGADGAGPVLPVQPVQRVIWHRAEGVDRPWRGVLRGVLADPVLARVHHRGDLGGVGAAFGVGDGGQLGRPRSRRGRDEGADPLPEPGVDDAGQVAGSGQVPFGDRGGQDLGGVQAGQLGGAQGPPQPLGLVAGLSPVLGRQVGQEQVPVILFAGRGGLGGPDRVQDGQVIGIGQGMVPGLGRGGLLAVSFEHAGQHAQCVPGLGCCGDGFAFAVGGDPVVAGQFGGRRASPGPGRPASGTG